MASDSSDEPEQFSGPERPVGYYERPVSYWQRIPVRSDTGGVVPMFIEGRERFMQERMRGMTPERRAWRKQWLQDQVLSHREPVDVPGLYTELYNPIRRFFNYPFRKLELALKPKYEWDRMNGGFTVQYSKPVVYPNDPKYPFVSTKEYDDYYTFGFKKSPLFKTADQIRAEEAKLH